MECTTRTEWWNEIDSEKDFIQAARRCYYFLFITTVLRYVEEVAASLHTHTHAHKCVSKDDLEKVDDISALSIIAVKQLPSLRLGYFVSFRSSCVVKMT